MLNIKSFCQSFITAIVLVASASVLYADAEVNQEVPPKSVAEVFSMLMDPDTPQERVDLPDELEQETKEYSSQDVINSDSLNNAQELTNQEGIANQTSLPGLLTDDDDENSSQILDDSDHGVIDEEYLRYKEYSETVTQQQDNVEDNVEEKDSSQVSVSKISTYEENLQKLSPNHVSWFKNPVFFLTEKIGSPNYALSHTLCNQINVATNKVNCLLYDVDDFSAMEGYFKKALHSDNYHTTGVDGDFAIISQELLYSLQQIENSDSPLLDVVAYLNGTYLFAFTNIVKNVFSIEQIMFNAKRDNRTVNIGYFDEKSKKTFDKYVKPIFTDNKISYIKQTLNKDNVCYHNKNIDFYVQLDDGLDREFKELSYACAKYITPLTFSDETLKLILNETKYLSAADISGYFNFSSLINFSKIYREFAKEYKNKLAKYLNDQLDKQAKSEADNQSNEPLDQDSANRDTQDQENSDQDTLDKDIGKDTLESKNSGQQETVIDEGQQISGDIVVLHDSNEKGNINKISRQKVLIKETDLSGFLGKKSTLNGKLLGVVPTPHTTSSQNDYKTEYVIAKHPIKTFGIRNILVATRYTKSENVIAVIDALIQDYFDVRNTFLTPDMKKFSIADILIGTSAHVGSYNHHHGLFEYTTSAVLSSSYKTKEQEIAMKVLTDYLPVGKKPVSFMIPTPDNNQLDIIYKKMQNLNKRKSELRAIRIFQSDIEKVQKALANIKSGKSIEDSIIKFGDLADQDVLNAIDDQSVNVNTDTSIDVEND